MKLYICGNGFDKHHGYKTGYEDYKKFLMENYLHSFTAFERFEYLNISKTDRWSDLEESLSIDYYNCIDDAVSEYYPDLNNDSDSRWHEIDIDLDEQTKFIYDFTGRYFLEWLHQVDFSNPQNLLNLDKSTKYVTFNYTSTLERVYNIPSGNIYHIHGYLDSIDCRDILDWFIPSFSTIEEAEITEQIQVDEMNNDTIRKQIQFGSIGNNSEAIKNELEKKYGQDDFYSVSIKPGISHIIKFCDASSKSLQKNFEALKLFISDKNIDEVIIMGHSILGVDKSYYSEIIVPALKDCQWTFYYYSEDDRNKIDKFINLFSLSKYTLKEW